MAETPRFRPFETALDPERTLALLKGAAEGADDGELFLERSRSESLVFDDGRIRAASFDASEEFGLRAVRGEAAGYAHAGEISDAALRAPPKPAVRQGVGAAWRPARAPPMRACMPMPIRSTARDFAAKTALLSEIDAFARARDPRVVQVMASITGEWQAVQIIRPDGQRVADLRPLVRMNVAVVVEVDGRRETGSFGTGGRFDYARILSEAQWKGAVGEALRRRWSTSTACPRRPARWRWCSAPAGPASCCTRRSATGWRAISTARRPPPSPACSASASPPRASPWSMTAPCPTAAARSHVDDEGTPTGRTVLIEDGILIGFLQDRQNARLMGVAPTGNGRRQSYAHIPMPRMTNTVMLGRRTDPAEGAAPGCKTASTPSISAAARSTSPPASSCSPAPRPT